MQQSDIGSPDGSAANRIDGSAAGQVVQAGSIGHVHFHTPVVTLERPGRLPLDPPYFVNRAAELALLSDHAEHALRDRLRSVVIHGAGGVGKTALAVHWARRHRDLFDDTLFVDLGVLRHRGGVDVADVLGILLRSLGVPGQAVPAGLGARLDAYRARTADRRVLLILDDVLQPAEARQLLPASGTGLVLITSRRQLSGLVVRGARPLPVPPLSQDAGIALVGELLGAIRPDLRPDELGDFVRLCGGFPLALCVAGRGLAARRRSSLPRLIARLTEGSRLLGGASDEEVTMQAHLDSAYAELSPTARQAYRRLADHPGADFGVEVAAVLTELAEPDLDDALEELCEAHLLTEIAEDRYRFHALVLLHATAQATADGSPAERAAAQARGVAWYLLGVQTADVTMAPTRLRLARPEPGAAGVFADGTRAWQWLNQERVNLISAVRLADRLGMDEAVWQFCEALWQLYHERGHHADLIESHRLGVEAARRCGDLAALARMHNQLGRARLELGELDAAGRELVDALVAARSAGHAQVEAAVLESTGLVHCASGRFADAVEVFRRTKAANAAAEDLHGVAVQTYHLAEALYGCGRLDEAVDEVTRVLQRIQGLEGEGSIAAKLRIMLGHTLRELGRSAAAVAEFEAAAASASALGLSRREAEARRAAGEIRSELGDTAAAEVHRRRLEELAASSIDSTSMPSSAEQRHRARGARRAADASSAREPEVGDQ
ncbi:NB-ARC domain-containing protein [Actinoalloteichus sp. GBA129-24]|uniref:NB-ARC domain-containing protein n=2 Tax=Pseudonocardiaceae TaxID=2070 RepID=A0AAC9LH60_9PSEU|nr:NB-ARC domain-containing protein [Actinoalloteichus fjordicus]APU22359.1 NB-ARC domain-containing protein [Actinoalloteichus sp. GBA129-24]